MPRLADTVRPGRSRTSPARSDHPGPPSGLMSVTGSPAADRRGRLRHSGYQRGYVGSRRGVGGVASGAQNWSWTDARSGAVRLADVLAHYSRGAWFRTAAYLSGKVLGSVIWFPPMCSTLRTAWSCGRLAMTACGPGCARYRAGDIADDPVLPTNPRRVQHRNQLNSLIEEILQSDTQRVVERLDSAQIPAARVNTLPKRWPTPSSLPEYDQLHSSNPHLVRSRASAHP